MSCVDHRVNCGNAKVTHLSPCQSATKPLVHQRNAQRLLEGLSPLNNQPERPALAASLRGDEIVHAASKDVEVQHWTFGTGMKPSIENLPTFYFPTGGGLSGDLAGATDLIHLQNTGYDGHSGILRLARAVLLPPRQNIVCKASIYALPDAGQALVFGTTQGARNMLSLRDNLNCVDLMSKCVIFMFDGQPSNDNAEYAAA